DAGQYSVVASNSQGTAMSGPVTVSVVMAQVSISGPSGVNAGSTAVFSAYYWGVSPVQFQWRFNGIPLPGETNSFLALPNIGVDQAGRYTVAVTNIYGGLESPFGELFVDLSAPAVSSMSGFQGVRAGDFVWLTGYFSGAPTPACQWYFNDTLIP